ncbi:MAG: homoserine/threonine efflux transporter [Desulfitobacteriaceae bacterium]
MTFFSTWLTVLVVGYLVVIIPGPNLAITMRNSLAYSRRIGIYTAVGLSAGNIIHITYCLIGIGVIITKSILLFNTIKWIGATYLIYLGIKLLRAKKQEDNFAINKQKKIMTEWGAFRMGLLTDLLNPKATMFFLALFTQVIQPGTPLPTQAIYGLTVVGTEFIWFALIVALISHHAIRSRYYEIAHVFERITGFVLIALGVRLTFVKGNF